MRAAVALLAGFAAGYEPVEEIAAADFEAWNVHAGGYGSIDDTATEVINALSFDAQQVANYEAGSGAALGEAFVASPDHAKPRARAFHVTGVIGDRFYVFGGVGRQEDGRAGGERLLNDLHFYDARRGGWSGELARLSCCRDGAVYDALGPRPAPAPRAHAGAAVVGSKLYVYGGRADAEGLEDGGLPRVDNYAFSRSGAQRALGDVHAYDERAAAWSGSLAVAGDLPAPRFGASVASYGVLLVVFGGVDGTGVAARGDVHVLNTTLLTSDERLYVYGGAATVVDGGADAFGTNATAAALCEDAWALDVAKLASRVPELVWTRVAALGAADAWMLSSPGGAARGARSGHELHAPKPGVLYALGGLDSEGLVIDQHAAMRDGRLLYQFGGVADVGDARVVTADFHIYQRLVLEAIRPLVDTGRTSFQSRDTGLTLYRMVA
ncbi:hypothetical protein JL720_2203 [Aureococcus anophagefferens]|nr:hypothetical protein JL720_2203 [Aureococcus anophagefferens]